MVAFAASFVVAAVLAPDYERAWALLPALWISVFPKSVIPALLAVGGWAVIFRAALPWMPSEARRSWLATLAVGALPALGLVRLVNRERLPGFWEAPSVIGNVGLLCAMLVAGLLLSRALLLWHHRAFARSSSARLTWSTWGAWAALALLVPAGLFVARSVQEPAGPHVFILLIDVLGAGHLGCYGYERATSPHIDRFAQDAVLFEQTTSSSTFTKTSVASLFSGLAPHHHGVYVGNLRDSADRVTSDVLSRDLTVLAEEMRRCGFLTLGLVHNEQLRPYMGFDQGFDLYDNEPGWMPGMATEFRAQRARWPRSERLFAYVHFLDLHGPYCPIPPYDTMFGRYSDAFDEIDQHSTWQKYVHQVRSKEIEPTQADLEQLRSLHDGLLVFVDEWIGRILDDLKADGLYDQSLIVLTGDHGDAFGQHGFINHANTPYEEIVRVPLLIKLPGSRNGGSRVKTPVGLVDVLPTLLDFVGQVSTAPRDGQSFLPWLEDPAAAPPLSPRTYVSEYGLTASLREGDWKLVYDPRRPLELYDLGADPKELLNVYAEEPEIARRLEERLEAVFAARRQLREGERVVVDPETLRELEALGYWKPGPATVAG